MANRFSQNFTLTDIFNNKKLKDKIPLINYKEKELENGKISRRTNAKTVNRQVFDTATSAARPFYKPMITTRSGDLMIISGELIGDHDGAVDAVYNALQSKRVLFIWTKGSINATNWGNDKTTNTRVVTKCYGKHRLRRWFPKNTKKIWCWELEFEQ